MSELRDYLKKFTEQLAELLNRKNENHQPLTDDELRIAAKELWAQTDPKDRRYRLLLWGAGQIRKGIGDQNIVGDDDNILIDSPRQD